MYSDSHELRKEASVSNAESSARVGISVRRKAADLDDDVSDQGNLFTLSSPQGSAAAAMANGYTFKLLGTTTTTSTDSNETWSPNMDGTPSSSTSFEIIPTHS